MTTRPRRNYFEHSVATLERQLDDGFSKAIHDAYQGNVTALCEYLEEHDEIPLGYERTQALIDWIKQRRRRGKPKQDAIPSPMLTTLNATAADLVREAIKQMPPRGQGTWGSTQRVLMNVVRHFEEQGYTVGDDEKQKALHALHRGNRTRRA